MSLVQSSAPDRRPSPALSLNLSSNNPFRNTAVPQGLPSPSPSLPTPRSIAQRPTSRNPFLAEFEPASVPHAQCLPQLSPCQADSMASAPVQPIYVAAADELFAQMSLNDSADNKAVPAGAASLARPSGLPRSGTNPGRPANHTGRPEQPRPLLRKEAGASRGPDRRENRRPRRNSESSIMDTKSMERDRNHRENRHRKPGDKVRKPRGLDLIDKLDVSGIYGPSMFHHDGPFDACNPHRNRKADRRAPMHAFPEGSANNAMGGSGPVNAKMNLDLFHGRGAEGFSDFSATTRSDVGQAPKTSTSQSTFYNPKSQIQEIHGDESTGLGTSTFLEGAPASRKDMERRGSENDASATTAGGIQRKKSLAQRLRGQPRRDHGGRVVSPDAPPPLPNGAGSPTGPLSGGGRDNSQEKNPFFNDYATEKGASIKIAEQQKPDRSRAPGSPISPNLERSLTCDAALPDEPRPIGFLTRMKSLKSGKKLRS